MADEPTTSTDDAVIDPETGRVTISQEALRNLRAAADRKATPAEPSVDVAKVQRENALLRAGVDLEHPNAKYLLNDPDLDVADTAAVKAAAAQLGVVPTPTAPVATTAPPPSDPRETAVRTSLQSDSVTPGNEPAPPTSLLGIERGRELLKDGFSSEQAIAMFSQTVAKGFAEGDTSLVIRGDASDGRAVDRSERLGYHNVREALR